MKKRKTLSKKIRFDVFKRDSFQCQYCGNSPPSVILEIDHILPVSKGGDNQVENLVSSCFDCNRGKSNKNLDEIPSSMVQNVEDIKRRRTLLKEPESQLSALSKHKAKIKRFAAMDIELIESIFIDYYPDSSFTDKSFNSILVQFHPRLDIHTLMDNMMIACARFNHDPEKTYKYFCGVCWNQIKGRGKLNA